MSTRSTGRAALALVFTVSVGACDGTSVGATLGVEAQASVEFRGEEIVDCDFFTQNCPAGLKCMPWADDSGSVWNATRCTNVAESPDEVGSPCTVQGSGVSGIDSCERGAMCWDVDPRTNAGSCVAQCQGDGSNPICVDPSTVCMISGGVLVLCLPTCDPIAQDCGEGRACYAVNDTFWCAPDVSGRSGAVGDACEFLNVCDPGLLCVGAEATPGCEASGCCTPICSVSRPQCPDGQTCLAWYPEPEAPPGFADVGICSAAR